MVDVYDDVFLLLESQASNQFAKWALQGKIVAEKYYKLPIPTNDHLILLGVK